MKAIDSLGDDEFADLTRQAVQLPDAPQQQIACALALGRRLGVVRPASAPGGLRALLASLSFDSWAQAAPALGMRAVGQGPRQLLYRAQGRDVDLRIAPGSPAPGQAGTPAGAQAYALSGQVLGPSEDEAGELTLQAVDRQSVHRAALDDLGAFRVDGVEPGRYRLSMQIGAERIVLPVLDIGPGV